MAKLKIRHHQFDADAVVFDKDGTLIDFHTLWGSRARASIDSLVEYISADEKLREALHKGIGYDNVTNRTVTGGPIATIPIAKLLIVAAAILYQAGFAWEQAESVVNASIKQVLKKPPTADEIRPLGDVRSTIEQLVANNIHVAIATTDDRDLTETALQHLEIKQHVSLIRCGDDSGPLKPSPELIELIAGHYGIINNRIAMVSDISSDLRMAREANCVCAIGVRDGAGDNDELAAVADIVIGSIDEIKIA